MYILHTFASSNILHYCIIYTDIYIYIYIYTVRSSQPVRWIFTVSWIELHIPRPRLSLLRPKHLKENGGFSWRQKAPNCFAVTGNTFFGGMSICRMLAHTEIATGMLFSANKNSSAALNQRLLDHPPQIAVPILQQPQSFPDGFSRNITKNQWQFFWGAACKECWRRFVLEQMSCSRRKRPQPKKFDLLATMSPRSVTEDEKHIPPYPNQTMHSKPQAKTEKNCNLKPFRQKNPRWYRKVPNIALPNEFLLTFYQFTSIGSLPI